MAKSSRDDLRRARRPSRGARALILLPIILVAAALVLGCREDPPSPPPPRAVRIASLADVNAGHGFVDSIALAPDASRVAVGDRNGSIQVWTPAGAAEATAPAYRQAIVDLAFSPIGGLLASLGRHRESALRLWQPIERAGATVWAEVAAAPVGRCLALRFDSAGVRLAVMCEREVLLFAVANLRDVARVSSPHTQDLTAFDLTVDGTKLLTAGHDREVIVWDTATATPTRRFSVGRSRRPGPLPRGLEPPEVWAVVAALSPDGSRAAVVTIEGTVYVWDLATGTELLVDAHPQAGGPPVGSLRFTSDGLLLAPTGDRFGMRLFDLSRKTSRVIAVGAKAYHAVAITDDAMRFAALTSLIVGGKLTYGVEIWKR